MTPSQLEHLRLIDAHLDKLLDIAAKRTPGEWEVEKDGSGRLYGIYTPFNQPDANGYTGAHIYIRGGHMNEADASFIASCAGNAEAGWRAMKAAIAGLLRVYDRCDEPTSGYAEDTFEYILAAYPLELITP